MASQTRSRIHERLATLADSTRCRLLYALDVHELTVGELCVALQLPQSTVSRHLRVLADSGWIRSRADGASRWYSMDAFLDAGARELWALVRTSVEESPAASQDLARVYAVIGARRARSEQYFADSADAWEGTRNSLYGDRADLSAMLALLDQTLIVGDLGCGTGLLSAALAPMVSQVIAVDASAEMISAAKSRTQQLSNVDVREGTLEELPISSGSLDVAVLMLVLHHVAEPKRVLREAKRVLRPDGRILICDMRTHERENYRGSMGHVWLGFDESVMQEWCAQSGFARIRCVNLPVDTRANGPALFTLTAQAQC